MSDEHDTQTADIETIRKDVADLKDCSLQQGRDVAALKEGHQQQGSEIALLKQGQGYMMERIDAGMATFEAGIERVITRVDKREAEDQKGLEKRATRDSMIIKGLCAIIVGALSVIASYLLFRAKVG